MFKNVFIISALSSNFVPTLGSPVKNSKNNSYAEMKKFGDRFVSMVTFLSNDVWVFGVWFNKFSE